LSEGVAGVMDAAHEAMFLGQRECFSTALDRRECSPMSE
jgi:hypothetical protein